ncbi:hypothetical protein [Planctomicrobium sp. SH664]|uniref:hypothetical protein n=1 Tax=Planctomicrobium sp. SH664 TaxID=3448125 RepID=UPI003F5BB70E
MLPTENSWPLIVVLLLIASGLGAGWFLQRRAPYLIGIAIAVGLMIAALIVDAQVVTLREKLTQDVYDMTSAFQQRDLDRTIQFVSPQARSLRMKIGTAYNVLKLEDDMRVTDVQVELFGEDTRATTRFRVNVTVDVNMPNTAEYRDRIATRWEAKWQLEGNEWRMIDIFELHPYTGVRMDRLDPYGSMVEKIYPNN